MEKQDIWSTSDIIKNRNNWSLAADDELLKHIQQISEKLFTKCNSAINLLNSFENDVNQTCTAIANTNNKFKALSDSQFIESKVLEENIDTPTGKISDDNESSKISQDQNIKLKLEEAINNGITLLDSEYEVIPVTDSDSECEEPTEIILKPRNPYMNRKLPYMIGSDNFTKYDHLGLVDASSEEEDDDDDEEEEEEEEEEKVESQKTVSLPTLLKHDSPRPQTQIIQISSSDSEDDTQQNEISEKKDGISVSKNTPMNANTDKTPDKTPPFSFADHLNATLQNYHSSSEKRNSFIPPLIGDTFSPPPFPNKDTNESSSENENSDVENDLFAPKRNSKLNENFGFLKEAENFENDSDENDNRSLTPGSRHRISSFSQEPPISEKKNIEEKSFCEPSTLDETSHHSYDCEPYLRELPKPSTKLLNVTTDSKTKMINAITDELNVKLRHKMSLPQTGKMSTNSNKPTKSQSLFDDADNMVNDRDRGEKENTANDDNLFGNTLSESSPASASGKSKLTVITNKTAESLFDEDDDNVDDLFTISKKPSSISRKQPEMSVDNKNLFDDVFTAKPQTTITSKENINKKTNLLDDALITKPSIATTRINAYKKLDLFDNESDSDDDIFSIINSQKIVASTSTSTNVVKKNENTTKLGERVTSEKIVDKNPKNDLLDKESSYKSAKNEPKHATPEKIVKTESKNDLLDNDNAFEKEPSRSMKPESNRVTPEKPEDKKSKSDFFENDDLFGKESFKSTKIEPKRVTPEKIVKKESKTNLFENDDLFENESFTTESAVNNELKFAIPEKTVGKESNTDFFANDDLFKKKSSSSKSLTNERKRVNDRLGHRPYTNTRRSLFDDDSFNNTESSDSKREEEKVQNSKFSSKNDDLFVSKDEEEYLVQNKQNESGNDRTKFTNTENESHPDLSTDRSQQTVCKPQTESEIVESKIFADDEDASDFATDVDTSGKLVTETERVSSGTSVANKSFSPQMQPVDEEDGNVTAKSSTASETSVVNKSFSPQMQPVDEEDGNVTAKSSTASETRTPGKLTAIRNLNINVNALLPGSTWSAVRAKEKQNAEAKKLSPNPLNDSGESSNQTPVPVQSSTHLLNSVTKERAKASNRRRPPTRRNKGNVTVDGATLTTANGIVRDETTAGTKVAHNIIDLVFDNVSTVGSSIEHANDEDDVDTENFILPYEKENDRSVVLVSSITGGNDPAYEYSNLSNKELENKSIVSTIEPENDNNNASVRKALHHVAKDRVKIAKKRNLPSSNVRRPPANILDADDNYSGNEETESEAAETIRELGGDLFDDTPTRRKEAPGNRVTSVLEAASAILSAQQQTKSNEPVTYDLFSESAAISSIQKQYSASAQPAVVPESETRDTVASRNLFSTSDTLSNVQQRTRSNLKNLFANSDNEDDDLFNDIFKEQSRIQSTGAQKSRKAESRNEAVATATKKEITTDKNVFAAATKNRTSDDLFGGKSTSTSNAKRTNTSSKENSQTKVNIFEEDDDEFFASTKKKLPNLSKSRKKGFLFDDNDDNLFDKNMKSPSHSENQSEKISVSTKTKPIGEKQRIVKLRSETVEKDPLTSKTMQNPS